MVETPYDLVADGYDAFYAAERYRKEDARLSGIVRSALVSGPTLDLGCGTGYLLGLVDLPAHGYVGVDVSRGMLAEARRKYPYHRFRCIDIRRLPTVWTGRFANVVSLFEPLNMVPTPAAVIRDAARVLRTGGRLVLMLARTRHRHSDILQARGIPNVLNRFTARDAARCVDGAVAGLTVERFSDSYDLLFGGKA